MTNNHVLCPYCGSAPKLLMGYNIHKIGCTNHGCPIDSIPFDVDQWNKVGGQTVMVLPTTEDAVLACIRSSTSDKNEYHYHEVVYYDATAEQWKPYDASNTFEAGETVVDWVYAEDVLKAPKRHAS